MQSGAGMSHRLLLISALWAGGCTGHSFGENNPGGGDGPNLGTYLEHGSIAVDGQNENVYVLESTYDYDTGQATEKLLMKAGPEVTRATTMADVTELSDLRLLFVDSGVLLMGERGAYDELVLYDRAGTAEIDRRSTSYRYHGTRVSGGGEFVAVADNTDPNLPIHLIRASDLSIRPVPHNGDWLEVNWANDSDRLVAAILYHGPTGELGSMRLMSWAVKSLAAADFPEAGGLWADPLFDISIPQTDIDPLFSYSWISVSPDDSRAIVPMVQRDSDGIERHRLAVITTATGELHIIDDARGPVGFTPDGSTIVSYRTVAHTDGQSRPHLLMIDVETLDEELLDEPSPGLIQYYVTRDGNFVVVGDFFGSSELTLVDLDNGKTTNLGRALGLDEFVSRPGTGELYLVDQGLYRLDLFDATLTEMDIGFVPEHINRLPSDQLVVDHPAAGRLEFLEPDTGAIVRSVEL